MKAFLTMSNPVKEQQGQHVLNACLAWTLVAALFALRRVNRGFVQYNLVIEQSAPADAMTPGTVYRFYVEANDASDKLSAIFGNDESPLVISTLLMGFSTRR